VGVIGGVGILSFYSKDKKLNREDAKNAKGVFFGLL